MRMSRLFFLFAVVLTAVFALSSCSPSRRATSSALSAQAVSQGSAASSARLQPSERYRLRYLYEEATKQKLLENHSAAFDLLQHCYSIDSQASEVLFDLALYRLLLRQDSLAEQFFVRALAFDPQNTFYLESLASYLINKRETERALPLLERLTQLQPRRTDVLSQLVNLYTGAERLQDAVRVLDRIEVLEGKMAAVSFRKAALYMAMDQSQSAMDELEALCREYPHELSYRLAIAKQYLDEGRNEEAWQIYEKALHTDPDNPQLQLSLLNYYSRTSQDSLYASRRDSLLFAPHTESSLRVELLRHRITDTLGASSESDSLARHDLEATFARLDSLFPHDVNLLELRAAYLATYDEDNTVAFISTMEQINEQDPSNTQALFVLIQYYGTHEDFHHLEELCRRGVLTHPEELICHYYLGVALYQQDRKPEALRAFQEGVLQKTAESRPTMVADLFSLMGDVLHEMNSFQEAYAAYDSCLVYQPDNLGCLNNYAYFLSLDAAETNRISSADQAALLDQAEEMSYRTIRLEPQNKTYLDTYAWILFLKESYAEAQIYMDRVCPPDSVDSVLLADRAISGVVFEHAGDIAAKNSRMEQAVRFWRLALQAGGDGLSALLPRKIKLRKYLKE